MTTPDHDLALEPTNTDWDAVPVPPIDLDVLLVEQPILPWGTKVLLQRDDPETQRASGLLIPQHVASRHQKNEGRVVAVGPHCTEYARGLVGKTVLYANYSGEEVDIRGTKYLIMMEEAIHAVLSGAVPVGEPQPEPQPQPVAPVPSVIVQE